MDRGYVVMMLLCWAMMSVCLGSLSNLALVAVMVLSGISIYEIEATLRVASPVMTMVGALAVFLWGLAGEMGKKA